MFCNLISLLSGLLDGGRVDITQMHVDHILKDVYYVLHILMYHIRSFGVLSAGLSQLVDTSLCLCEIRLSLCPTMISLLCIGWKI